MEKLPHYHFSWIVSFQKQRYHLCEMLGDRRGYSHLKEEALDRIKWRNRFGEGCGPVVWQITDDDHVIYSTSVLTTFFLPVTINKTSYAQNPKRVLICDGFGQDRRLKHLQLSLWPVSVSLPASLCFLTCFDYSDPVSRYVVEQF
jgi:hypothetical protein